MEHHHEPSSLKRSRWVFWGFAVVGAFFLLTEHTAHVLGALPYLLLMLCPLMHLFMHHGHHGHGHRSEKEVPKTSEHEEPKS